MKSYRAAALITWVLAALLAMGRVAAHPLGEPPGRLVDLGGYRLHLYCQGNGGPPIIIDTGLGGTSLEWEEVMRELAPYGQVCVYDRAGYGWSDPGPAPRTSSTIVNELYLLLLAAGVDGPYVLVGHSFGGYNVQLFARRYPFLTAGVVLIDSSHPDQVERFQAPPYNVRTAPSSRFGIVRFRSGPKLPAGLSELGRMVATYQHQHWLPRRFIGMELLGFRDSASELRAASPMPPLPLVVLTRGKRAWPHSPEGDRLEQLWLTLQSELAASSPTAVHLIALDSGHLVHVDQPALVAYAVTLVADAERVHSGALAIAPVRMQIPQFSSRHAIWLKDSIGIGSPITVLAQAPADSGVR